MCGVLGVSESGYYKHLRNANRPYKYADLLAQIYELLREEPENANYGVRRIYLHLRNNKSYKGGYSRILRICKENNLIIHRRKNPNSITKADMDAQKSENLIRQDFTAEKPNEKWITDITEIQCRDGKLYFSPVLDCFDGSIVGFKMDTNMKAELCTEAFRMACFKERARGMILHSDRGSQYTSAKFRGELTKCGAVQSMSGKGRCYDNARMESFFATLKKEKLYQINTKKMTISDVRTAIFRYISYYNRRRIYSTNGGYPPLVYREKYFVGIAA